MAVLSDTDRARIWRGLMRYWSRTAEGCAITKADLRAAVDSVDSWIDNNAATLNSAIPLAARNGLTAEQKAMLLASVALMRRLPELAARIAEID
jgi:hypothetical protein